MQPSNLFTQRHHVPSREENVAAEWCELLCKTGATGATGGTLSFGADVELPADLAISVLSWLSRCTISLGGGIDGEACFVGPGELEAAAAVCKEWRGVCLALRASTPACARDVAVRLRLNALRAGLTVHTTAGLTVHTIADAEYTIYHHGKRSRPLRIFCHNVLSSRPTEFLTLPAGPAFNFSYIPARGTLKPVQSEPTPAASVPTHVATRFTKLRLCPWLLLAKTDDYTYSNSESRRGGPLCQTYWNGARTLTFSEVPYATARNSAPGITGPPGNGCASIDLSHTDFGVRLDGFKPMGCASWGVLVALLPYDAPAHAGDLDTPAADHDLLTAMPPLRQRIVLHGGGFAGRLTPAADLTCDERAQGGNFDHEGRNGGWVLPLHPMYSATAQPPLDDAKLHRLARPAQLLPPREFSATLTPVDAAGTPVSGLQPAHDWRVSAYQHGVSVDSDGGLYVPRAWTCDAPSQ